MESAQDRIWQALRIEGPESSEPDFVHIPAPPPLPSRRWRQALRSIRELLTQPEAPSKAIEVFYAISLAEFEGWFQRFLSDPEGGGLLARRPELGRLLCDPQRLASLPTGSFGHAFAEFVERNGIDPEGVLEANRQAQRVVRSPELDPIRGWLRERLIFSHDLSHVLTGYDTSGAGETRLLAFALGQYGGGAYTLLTLAAALENWRGRGRGWPRELVAAWRRGRRARWLITLPLEELLAEPLPDARRAAGL